MAWTVACAACGQDAMDDWAGDGVPTRDEAEDIAADARLYRCPFCRTRGEFVAQGFDDEDDDEDD